MRPAPQPTPSLPRRPLALVTDVSNRLEFELARELVAVGYNLIIVCDDPEVLLEHCDELRAIGDHPMIETIEADLSVPGSAARIRDLAADVGHVDVLVNNASGATDSTVVELTRLVAEDMVHRGQGKILFSTDLASPLGLGAEPDVHSRGFLYSFAMELHHELENTGVTVTAMPPVSIDGSSLPRALVRNVARAGYQALVRGDPLALLPLNN